MRSAAEPTLLQVGNRGTSKQICRQQDRAINQDAGPDECEGDAENQCCRKQAVLQPAHFDAMPQRESTVVTAISRVGSLAADAFLGDRAATACAAAYAGCPCHAARNMNPCTRKEGTSGRAAKTMAHLQP
jgi:hypothetical protein